ncbi:MAG: hypothetical protein KME31_35615 [Tolypothrix carrinoi HA7290-LM1]|nr:hypothetical protein [Tolypothrix carrinoi HA7290-LM1]
MGIQTPPNLTVQQIKDFGYLVLNPVWALALGRTLKLFLPFCTPQYAQSRPKG